METDYSFWKQRNYCPSCGGERRALNTNSYGCGGRGSREVCEPCDKVYVQTSGGMLATPGGERYEEDWKPFSEYRGQVIKAIKPHKSREGEEWFFLDEFWDKHGPYKTEAIAQTAIKERVREFSKLKCCGCDAPIQIDSICKTCRRCDGCGGHIDVCPDKDKPRESEKSEPRTFSNLQEAWGWLYDHPSFFREGRPGFKEALDVHVTSVNPKTQAVDKDPKLNTEEQIWLEIGPWKLIEGKVLCPGHDVDLDCGARTFYQAIIELANLALKKYGDYDA
jgi:hypothetical protein